MVVRTRKHTSNQSHPFLCVICCRIDVDVLLLILPSTMHINVLYFVLFSFFPVEKRIFVFLHPFNICPIEKKSGVEKEETWKNLVVVMNQRSTSTPFATSKWGFRSSYFSCLFFSFFMQALKWIHLHLVSGLRFTIQGKNFFVPFAKNEICYALIKWSCCTFFVRFILKILSFILILKTAENVNVNEKKIIG